MATKQETDEQRDQAIRSIGHRIESAMNDHAVGLAEAIRSAAPDRDIGRGLLAVAEAINNLAEAVREGNARR